MVRLGGLIILILGLAGCQEPEPVVSLWTPEQLVEARNIQKDILLLDIRKPKKYNKGHIPGAAQLWRSDIQSTEYDYGGMRAEREHIEFLMDSLGANSETTILCYDDRGGCDAARMWWLLRYYGHEKAGIIDGGLEGWKHSGLATSQEPYASPSNGGFRFVEEVREEMLAERSDVEKAVEKGGFILVDTRTDEEFEGSFQKKGAARAGRIPGSVHYNWGNAVEMDKYHQMKSIKDLQYDLKKAGVTPDTPIIAYCHTGVRSAHTTFVLTELLGYNNVSNYDGSWTEWSHFDHLPAESSVEP